MRSIPDLDKAEFFILCRAGILLLLLFLKITGAAASTYSLVQADPTGIKVVVADPTGKTDFTGCGTVK